MRRGDGERRGHGEKGKKDLTADTPARLALLAWRAGADEHRPKSINDVTIAQRCKREPLTQRKSKLILVVSVPLLPPMVNHRRPALREL